LISIRQVLSSGGPKVTANDLVYIRRFERPMAGPRKHFDIALSAQLNAGKSYALGASKLVLRDYRASKLVVQTHAHRMVIKPCRVADGESRRGSSKKFYRV
jgi:hypothetical protein